jgi:hypothetical protein
MGALARAIKGLSSLVGAYSNLGLTNSFWLLTLMMQSIRIRLSHSQGRNLGQLL